MILYSNIQRLLNVPPSEYRALASGRRSFSFLKSEKGGVSPHFEPSKPMLLGSTVHDILSGHYTGPVDTELFAQARAFAIDIKRVNFPDTWHLLEFETSYTATLQFMGLSLPVMGRTDAEFPGHATIDFKITAATSDKQFATLIAHMKYDDQLWHYGNLAQTPKRYLLPYSTKRKCCLGLVAIDAGPRNEFWEQSVIKFGTV